MSSEVLVGMSMELEHLVPISAGGHTIEENLWLSCRRCNEFKASLTLAIDPETGKEAAIFNPRRQNWPDHFRWNDSGRAACKIGAQALEYE